MIYVNAGFICLGGAVGFILWRFINNLQAGDYTVGNVSSTIGIVIGGFLTKYLAGSDTTAVASYFIGLFGGIILYNVWGVVWRKMLNNKDPEVADVIAELRSLTAKIQSTTQSVEAGQKRG